MDPSNVPVVVAKTSLAIVVVLTVQTTWMADWRPFGVTGDLLLLLAIASGLAGGAMRGAVVGFACGFAMDLVLPTPFGLSCLTYLAVGYVVGSIGEGVLRSAPWIPVLATALGSAFGVGFFVVLGQLVGQQFRLPELTTVVAVTTAVNTVLAVPALWAARWIDSNGGRSMLRNSLR